MSNSQKTPTGRENEYYQEALERAANGQSEPGTIFEIFFPPTDTELEARNKGTMDGTFIRELKKDD